MLGIKVGLRGQVWGYVLLAIRVGFTGEVLLGISVGLNRLGLVRD